MSRRLVDPRTRQATAFYAALSVTVYDIIQHGFNMLSLTMLATMAGVGVLGALGAITKSAKPPEPQPPE